MHEMLFACTGSTRQMWKVCWWKQCREGLLYSNRHDVRSPGLPRRGQIIPTRSQLGGGPSPLIEHQALIVTQLPGNGGLFWFRADVFASCGNTAPSTFSHWCESPSHSPPLHNGWPCDQVADGKVHGHLLRWCLAQVRGGGAF